MTAKYESGVTHPSELIETFRKLDFADKEKFIEMLSNEDGVSSMLLTIEKAVNWLANNADEYIWYDEDSDMEPCMESGFVVDFVNAMVS